MSRFIGHLKALAMTTLGTFGGLGLAALALIDSSFLPLPEAVDAMVMVLVVQHPGRWPYYAAMATGGSLVGCYVLYSLARSGGHAFLRRHLREGHVERGMAAFRKYGLLTVVVPAILPPPMPFKPFVFIAGVADTSPAMFVAAVVIGRGFRYGAEALLAFWYGAEAAAFGQRHLQTLSVSFALFVAALALGTILWRRRRAS